MTTRFLGPGLSCKLPGRCEWIAQGGITVRCRMRNDKTILCLYLSHLKSHHLLTAKFKTCGGVVARSRPGPILVRRRRAMFALAAAITMLAAV